MWLGHPGAGEYLELPRGSGGRTPGRKLATGRRASLPRENRPSGDAGPCSYTEVANNVQKEETVLSIQFVLLDCSHLKVSLVQHCNEWQTKFTTLLKEMAARRLLELHAYLQDNGDKYGLLRGAAGGGRGRRPTRCSLPALRISHPPQTLEELGASLQLMETLQHDLPNLETQIPPIHEQFTILEKYEVPVQENVSSWGVPSPGVGPTAAVAQGEC